MSFHSSNKLYQCDLCKKYFKQKHYLKKHRSKNCEPKYSEGMEDDHPQPQRQHTSMKNRILRPNERGQTQYSSSSEGEEVTDEEDEDRPYLDAKFARVLRRVGFQP